MTAKKILALFLAFMLALSCIGCGGKDKEKDKEVSSSLEKTEDSSKEETQANQETSYDFLAPSTENQNETQGGAQGGTQGGTQSGGQTNAQKKPADVKNIILIIGDGMGANHIEAAQLATGKKFSFTGWQNTNVNTDSLNGIGEATVLTDSAAGATALATGTMTRNGHVGMDSDAKELETILDLAKSLGKSTGVVTTDYLYGATPASFSAHVNNRGKSAEITLSQKSSNVDFLCGLRNDEHYLPYQPQIESGGYYFSTATPTNSTVNAKQKAYLTLDIENDAANAIRLSKAAELALGFLERDTDGFVLMIEQAHIDKRAEANDFSGVVNCVSSLNETVETVMKWAKNRKDTAVMVVADHETGGLQVSSTTDLGKSYSHPGGNTVFYSFSCYTHTQEPIKLFVYGIKPVFSDFKYYASNDLIKNIDVYKIMQQSIMSK